MPSSTEFRAGLTEYLNQVCYQDARVPVTRHGRVVAYLVPREFVEGEGANAGEELEGSVGTSGAERGAGGGSAVDRGSEGGLVPPSGSATCTSEG